MAPAERRPDPGDEAPPGRPARRGDPRGAGTGRRRDQRRRTKLPAADARAELLKSRVASFAQYDDPDTPHPYVGRGGVKLAAAIAAFGLAPRLKGVVAIDVGAGTGGFTDCMLQHGAAHVTALENGRGVLHSQLQSDPRVTSLERTNIKTASLSVAAGPFDFFAVDVSHMAARSVLKPLARRLRAGTHGVVLLKPSFELPKVLVPPGGVVDSRNLRKLAFNRFKRRAAQRGFRILDRVVSPIRGGSGNVEVLLHLVFDGVPEPSGPELAPEVESEDDD